MIDLVIYSAAPACRSLMPQFSAPNTSVTSSGRGVQLWIGRAGGGTFPAFNPHFQWNRCKQLLPEIINVRQSPVSSGCKIKALRAKTNTYIKTPVRGEEPVFVVTGRKEDVALAKREILSAADHFSQIRASRTKNNINSTLAFGQLVANQPGQTTTQVRAISAG